MLYESVPEAEYVADMPEVYKIYMVRMTVKSLTNLRMYNSIGRRCRNATALQSEWSVR